MFLGFGRVLIVFLALGTLSLEETRFSFQCKANLIRNRYLPLSVTYRQKILEKIEAPFVVSRTLSKSAFASEAGSLDLEKKGTSRWLVPYRDPIFGSVSLQL
jgi:hypothetical protein